MHREEHDERQRGRGLELAGRRFDARQHAGEIGRDEKNEESADATAEMAVASLPDHILDLLRDAGDDGFQQAWRRSGCGWRRRVTSQQT